MAVRRTRWCLVAQALHCISGVTYLTWGLPWWRWSLMRVSTIGQGAAFSEWSLNMYTLKVTQYSARTVMTTIWCLQESWFPILHLCKCDNVIFVNFRQIQSFLQEFPKVNWSELRVCTGAGSDLQKQVDCRLRSFTLLHRMGGMCGAKSIMMPFRAKVHSNRFVWCLFAYLAVTIIVR